MITKLEYRSGNKTKHSILLTVIFMLLGFLSLGANAVVIDFDDVNVYELGGYWYDHPVSNQYESLGLIVDNGYLHGEPLPDGTYENSLVGGNRLKLIFVGPLPTFVSMSVSGGSNYGAVFLNASGPNGYQGYHQTSGESGPDEFTPYEPNEYVSFTSPTGISHIELAGYFDSRISAFVDDLTFEYTSVPEPSSLVLLLLGCFGLLWRQGSVKIRAHKLDA